MSGFGLGGRGCNNRACSCQTDDTIDGFGTDLAPLTVGLNGLATKALTVAEPTSASLTDSVLIARADGSFARLSLPNVGNYAQNQPGKEGGGMVNGNFDIWQSGPGPFVVSNGGFGYTADQWWQVAGAGATSSVTLEPQPKGSAPKGPWRARWTRTVSGTGPSLFTQPIEDVRSFAGQTVTFSWYSDTAVALDLDVYLQQWFGAAGDSMVAVPSQRVHIQSYENRNWVTFSVPAVTGKTIGAGSYLQVFLSWPIDQPNTDLHLWGAKIEPGSVATPYQREDPGLVYMQCQRYFEVQPPPFGQVVATTDAYFPVQFMVPKRTSAPLLYIYGGTFVNLINEIYVAFRTPTQVVYNGNEKKGFLAATGVPSSMTKGYMCQLGQNVVFDARLILTF